MNNKKKINKTVPTILTVLIGLLIIGIIITFIAMALEGDSSKMGSYMNILMILVIFIIVIYIIKNNLYPSIKALEDCFNIYSRLNQSLYDYNIDSVAEFISPEIYNEYKEKEIDLKNKNIQYAFAPGKIKSAKSRGKNEAEFYFDAIEYQEDSEKKIISGSNNMPISMGVKIGYSKDKNHFMSRCKKCKKYYKDSDIDTCEKCGNKLVKDSYSIVITSINKKEA